MGELKESRENNFNILRLLAALFVLGGHMGQLLGIGAMTLCGLELHAVGVFILFILGGYLVSLSWLRDPHPGRYALRRFFRFYPPFLIAVLLFTFVGGPLVSNLGAPAYFGSWYSSFLWNLRFFPVFSLPGVFESNPAPGVVNGALWTIPVEAALYVLLPFVLTILRVRRRSNASFRACLILTAVLCAAQAVSSMMAPGAAWVFYGTDWKAGFRLVVCYAMGVLYTWPQMKRLLNGQVAVLMLVLLCAFQFAGVAWRELIAWIALPYLVFSFALSPNPRFARVALRYDLSYGIYLYGFFFQQWIVSLRISREASWGFYTCLLASLVLSLAAAFLSCLCVEKPCQRLCAHLLAGRSGGKTGAGKEIHREKKENAT